MAGMSSSQQYMLVPVSNQQPMQYIIQQPSYPMYQQPMVLYQQPNGTFTTSMGTAPITVVPTLSSTISSTISSINNFSVPSQGKENNCPDSGELNDTVRSLAVAMAEQCQELSKLVSLQTQQMIGNFAPGTQVITLNGPSPMCSNQPTFTIQAAPGTRLPIQQAQLVSQNNCMVPQIMAAPRQQAIAAGQNNVNYAVNRSTPSVCSTNYTISGAQSRKRVSGVTVTELEDDSSRMMALRIKREPTAEFIQRSPSECEEDVIRHPDDEENEAEESENSPDEEEQSEDAESDDEPFENSSSLWMFGRKKRSSTAAKRTQQQQHPQKKKEPSIRAWANQHLSTAELSALIAQVKKRDVVWDSRLSKKPQEREKAWSEIAKHFPRYKMNQLREAWKLVRNVYARRYVQSGHVDMTTGIPGDELKFLNAVYDDPTRKRRSVITAKKRKIT